MNLRDIAIHIIAFAIVALCVISLVNNARDCEKQGGVYVRTPLRDECIQAKVLP